MTVQVCYTVSQKMRRLVVTIILSNLNRLSKLFHCWWSGIVVSALASINEVNQRRARLVACWDGWLCPGSIPSAGHLFQYVTNQPPKANSAFHPSGVGKWVPASAGKAKAGMVHFVSGWTWGVQVKLWDLLRTRAIPERLRGVFTTRCYTNARLPYLTLPGKSCYIFNKKVYNITHYT